MSSSLVSHAVAPVSARTTARHWAESFVRRLHTWIGVLIGPFLLIAAFTGTAYVWTPQLEALVYRPVLTATHSGTPLSLTQQIAAARQQVGDALPLSGVRPAPAAGQTTRALFNDPTLGEGERRAVFIDPVSGAVLGEHTVYGTSGALPLRSWSSKLHRQLLAGETGRLYSELAASWLWLAALGGVFVWRRQRLRRPAVTPGAPRPLRERHAQLGLWLLVALLFLSASGLTWSRYAGAHIGQWRQAWGWSTPSLQTTLPLAAATAPGGAAAASSDHSHHHHEAAPAVPTHAGTADVDQVLATARTHGIDAGLIEIRPPAAADKAWTVTEIDRRWPTQVDAAAIDGHTLEVISRVRFEEFPLAAKLTRWAVDLHMGVMFGWLNQLVLTALGLGLLAMIVWGYTLWWRRRALTRREPTLWQALEQAPWRGRLGVLVLGVALGTALPVMGASLLVMLALDGVLSLRR